MRTSTVKRAGAVILTATMLITMNLSQVPKHLKAAPAGPDYDVNSVWKFSNSDTITTEYTAKNEKENAVAYSRATSDVRGIGITAIFEKNPERYDGASYLVSSGDTQASYNATANMFYGSPDPSKLPALGVYTQPSHMSKITTGTHWDRINYNGQLDVGTLTLRFSQKVTNPILDFSGIGGYVYETYGSPTVKYFARGSFNQTDMEVLTEGVTLTAASKLTNLKIIDGRKFEVQDRNTTTTSVLKDPTKPYISFGPQNQYRSPKLLPAGTGTIKLNGTFNLSFGV